MLKKTCLAAFSLSLFVPLANATAYTDKVAEMQAKYELAVKGDKAAAAYVCRQGNLPQLKVRLIDRDKHAQACRLYAQNIASDPQVYRWFMEWSMHLPHELIGPVFKNLTDAGIYPVNKINYLFASWLYGEKKSVANLSEAESTKLYQNWVTENYKAGHPGFAGLYVFLKTEKNGKSSLSDAEIDQIVDNCLKKKDFDSLKLFYSRLGEGNYEAVEKKLNGKPTHSSLDIARALTQDKLKLTPEQFAAFFRSLESGLYSRFAVCTRPAAVQWESCAPDAGDTDLHRYFRTLSDEMLGMHTLLLKSPTRVSFTPEQWARHTDFFTRVLAGTHAEGRDAALSVIFRHGLLMMRLAAVLTVFRKVEDYPQAAEYVCTDTDFRSAMLVTQTLLEHSLLLSTSLPDNIRNAASAPASAPRQETVGTLEATEMELIEKALAECNGNRTRAAQLLGISRRTLHRRLAEYRKEK